MSSEPNKKSIRVSDVVFSQLDPFTEEDIREAHARAILPASETLFDVYGYLEQLVAIGYLSYDYGKYSVVRE